MKRVEGNSTDIQSQIETIANEMYRTLADAFPICCASDEFTFFPQAVRDDPDWSVWDDLSPDRVDGVCRGLSAWEAQLGGLADAAEESGGDLDTRIDAESLIRASRTVREQLQDVRNHENQPTFILTVATTGLIQALDEDGEDAWRQRIETLPAFLERSTRNLRDVPELFARLGIEMAEATTGWLRTLGEREGIGEVGTALADLSERLKSMPTVEDFHLPPDLLERVLADHMGSCLSSSDILDELRDERAFMRAVLQEETLRTERGESWREAWAAISLDPLPEGGKVDLIKGEIQSLREHCVDSGFLDGASGPSGTLEVTMLPDSLTSVRAADSYNARPGHPYPGGTFYIFGGGSLGAAVKWIHPGYRMTAAHEAYPGHHLLDMSRWNHPRPLRRPLEYPLFYEGWACFAEELVRETGYFDRPYDRMILARRRYRHAVRGAVDLLMHLERLDLDGAARILTDEGFSPDRALKTAEKYALRPGYQMCYTLGSRKFRRLFDRFGGGKPGSFVREVLGTGEVGFDHLEMLLTKDKD